MACSTKTSENPVFGLESNMPMQKDSFQIAGVCANPVFHPEFGREECAFLCVI